MKTIEVVTSVRGFLNELINSEMDNYRFINKSQKYYETSSKKKLLLSKIIRSRILDYMGLFKIVKCNSDADIVFSYNRFVKSNRPYIIYLENPLALVHYSTQRPKTYMGKYNLKKMFHDANLIAIVCMSKACYSGLQKIYNVPKRIRVEQIYPCIKNDNNQVNINKCFFKRINCIYLSSDFNLKGGKDILQAIRKLHDKGINSLTFTIITKVSDLDSYILREISKYKNVKIMDFSLNREELKQIYSKSVILLNPSRQDSFSLVILEAMKYGNTIISTDLYAIPEMVEQDENGFLISPRYRFWNEDKMPNEYVWNHRKKTIYSDYTDDTVVDFLVKILYKLQFDRKLLSEMCAKSWEIANKEKFCDIKIRKQWDDLFESIL